MAWHLRENNPRDLGDTVPQSPSKKVGHFFLIRPPTKDQYLRHPARRGDDREQTMAIKPFEQIYPGQNAPDLKPKKKGVNPQEWERKQRMKEYRIAARREKRNRKSDEKKQRKLNATILRRMVREHVQLWRKFTC
jgi:hypothetical protein